jgi:AcrR family transcriptional regulator
MPHHPPNTAPPGPRRARRLGRPRKDAARAGGALSRERIVRAALALVDARGLAALTARDLAANLDVAPAALYWHVCGRDALLTQVIALALSDVARDPAGGAWQVRLEALMRRFRAALRAHPHLAPAVASELAYNSGFDADMLEQIVGALEEARFEGSALVDAYNVVVAAMCGFATLELSRAPAQAVPAWEAQCRARIDSLEAPRHPRLAHHRDALRNRAFLLRWTSGAQQPLDSGFDAWVEVVIRGLDARPRTQPRPTQR